MQNALNVEQARRHGLVARRRKGLFSDWSSIRNVYRGTRKKRQHAIRLWHVAYSHFKQGREPHTVKLLTLVLVAGLDQYKSFDSFQQACSTNASHAHGRYHLSCTSNALCLAFTTRRQHLGRSPRTPAACSWARRSSRSLGTSPSVSPREAPAPTAQVWMPPCRLCQYKPSNLHWKAL